MIRRLTCSVVTCGGDDVLVFWVSDTLDVHIVDPKP